MRCQSGRCPRRAEYSLRARSFSAEFWYTRDYCAEHTRKLVGGMAQLADQCDESLHDYLEIAHCGYLAGSHSDERSHGDRMALEWSETTDRATG